jgi:uncharacterized membrane protein YphA (DoxX/SURF4 family)
MNTVLWIVQGILAFMFMMTGAMKLMRKKDDIAPMMGFVEDFSQVQIRGIGVLELMGAMGLILPRALDILPILTPLAAVGLGLTMVGAFFIHLRRKEIVPMGIMNMMLFGMALFVAVLRFYFNISPKWASVVIETTKVLY